MSNYFVTQTLSSDDESVSGVVWKISDPLCTRMESKEGKWSASSAEIS